MRPEQITTLNALEEKLVDLFTFECHPEEWRKVKSKEERETAYREKKVAMATVQLVGRIQNVLRDLRDADTGDPKRPPGEGTPEREPDDLVEREALRLEREGRAVLKRHGAKAN